MTTRFQKLHITPRLISAALKYQYILSIVNSIPSSQIRKGTKLLINYATTVLSMQIIFMSTGLIFTSYS